ncbi:MAG: 2-oxoglutarate dehydrogenase E1 component, partial [Candidatus Acidiferrales bacterium]
MSREQAIAESAASKESQEKIWEAFRRWGYLQANLNPLGDFAPVAMPELGISGPDAEAARRVYCASIGAEFMHITDRERRQWIQDQMEAEAAEPDRARILELLIRAEIFEHVLQTRYLGTKRYSLEGEAALLPLLDAILNAASEQGAEKAMVAMSHRGRLNVMVNIVGRPAAELFARFEDVDPRSTLGGGDVKYHMGATGDFHAANGRVVEMHLVSNPSHLEAVDP